MSTFTQPQGRAVHVSGDEFMRATWSIMFANRDLAEIGDSLISNL